MEKYKALEFNGVSFYFNWGYHSSKKGVYDFDGVRDVQKAFDAAAAADLHVITRAGPYINAEVVCSLKRDIIMGLSLYLGLWWFSRLVNESIQHGKKKYTREWCQ